MNNYRHSYNIAILSALAFLFGLIIILSGFFFRSTFIFSAGLIFLVTTVPTLVILKVSLYD